MEVNIRSYRIRSYCYNFHHSVLYICKNKCK